MNFSIQAQGVNNFYQKGCEISGNEMLRSVEVAKDFFVITLEERNSEYELIKGVDFECSFLWKFRKDRDKTGPVITYWIQFLHIRELVFSSVVF